MNRHLIAKDLVDHHVIAEGEITLAIEYARRGGDRPNEPIKLLEVNRATVSAGLMPVYFGPSGSYPSVVIIEITEEEYRAVQNGSLTLPEGWDEARVLHGQAA
jgi:hypothetical protein